MVERKGKNKPIVPARASAAYWGPSSMLQEMENFLDNFRMSIEDFGSPLVSVTSPRIPPIDMKDMGDHFMVEAELPGLTKDEVDIEIDTDALYIKAQRSQNIEEKGEGYLRRERGYMSFYRRIPLPEDIDPEKVGAKLEAGVLKINLPKVAKTEEEPRRKKVSVE
jgi:HSP20 family protein